ncbi:GNAT family N-acetyltransferase [Vagococcus elongatus]|uniref:GNAT family N-acetyltransferase n=1 Tax=Vagococcus elongatus TaxID=180344 RepID=A0A430B4N5_9ENTE|nr:GNAT family N-acetyltransferase [Vagococcus elongatus]RSU15268.1 GNAT family N-acetyltransferase [Vagococcus elongatus]
MKVIDETARVAFVDDAGKLIGEITFELQGTDTLVLNHTGVDPEYRGQGIAGQLMDLAVEKARREGKKILPMCSYAVRAFEKNPDYGDVLKK